MYWSQCRNKQNGVAFTNGNQTMQYWLHTRMDFDCARASAANRLQRIKMDCAMKYYQFCDLLEMLHPGINYNLRINTFQCFNDRPQLFPWASRNLNVNLKWLVRSVPTVHDKTEPGNKLPVSLTEWTMLRRRWICSVVQRRAKPSACKILWIRSSKYLSPNPGAIWMEPLDACTA